METAAADYLLLKIHDNFKWGEPYKAKEFEYDSEQVHQLTAIGLIDRKYWPKPVIKNSRKSCKIRYKDDEPCPENIFDILGTYTLNDPSQEGFITLYEKCIRRFGARYYRKHGKMTGRTKEECIEMVRDMIIWHELGHWIAHWMPAKDKSKWNPSTFIYNYGTKDIHEGLAQLFTHYAIINIEKERERAEFQLLFNFMLIGQAPCYHKHFDILAHKDFSWNNFFDAFQKFRKDRKTVKSTPDNLLKLLKKS